GGEDGRAPHRRLPPGPPQVVELLGVGVLRDRHRVAVPTPPDDKSPEEVLLPFTVRRAVEKVGRNDPCPCGSGKKYKRCCLEKDRARLADPSPYAGLTMEEAKRDPGRHGDPAIFFEMSADELDLADKKALAPELLVGLFEAYVEKKA